MSFQFPDSHFIDLSISPNAVELVLFLNFFFPPFQWHCPNWLSSWSSPLSNLYLSTFIYPSVRLSIHPLIHLIYWLLFASITCVHPPRFGFESLCSLPNLSLKQRFSSKVLRYNGYHGYVTSYKLSVFVNDLFS